MGIPQFLRLVRAYSCHPVEELRRKLLRSDLTCLAQAEV